MTKIGLGCPGWGHPISEKRPGGQECARTREGQEPWENRGRTVGGSKKPWENRGDFTKNRGRTVGTLQRTVGEPWGLYKEPWENRGDFTKNRGRTVGIQVLKSNDLVVTKSENRGRTVGEPWGFSGEPWENRGDFPESRGSTVGIFRRTVGEPWGFSGEPWENRGGKFENRGDPKWTQNPMQKNFKKTRFGRSWRTLDRGVFLAILGGKNSGRTVGGQIENRGDLKGSPPPPWKI